MVKKEKPNPVLLVISSLFTGAGLFFGILGFFILVAIANLNIVRNTYCRLNCIKTVGLGEEFSLIRGETARIADTEIAVALHEIALKDIPGGYQPSIRYDITAEGNTYTKTSLDRQTVKAGAENYSVDVLSTDWETFIRFRVIEKR